MYSLICKVYKIYSTSIPQPTRVVVLSQNVAIQLLIIKYEEDKTKAWLQITEYLQKCLMR